MPTGHAGGGENPTRKVTPDGSIGHQTTEGGRVELLTDRIHSTVIDERAGNEKRRRSLDDSIPTSVSLALLAAWLLGLTWLFAISPEPDPSQPTSLVDNLISTAMFGSWLGAFVGLGAHRRFGLVSTVGGGLLLAGAGVLCGITGHTGLWIPIQIGVGIGLAAMGALASRLT